nr:MAG TPA: hypothetical protein [Caudoviricetes sp.]
MILGTNRIHVLSETFFSYKTSVKFESNRKIKYEKVGFHFLSIINLVGI